MHILKDFSEYNSTSSSIVTIGSFDGLHIGHQSLLKNIKKISEVNNLKSILLTFSPTPSQYFSSKIYKQINTLSQKIKLIENQKVDTLIIQNFNEYIANLDAETFVFEILVKKFKIKKILIGYDHRFGKNRSAGFNELVEFGKKFNFEVIKIEALEINNNIISSTKIRNLIEIGNIEQANEFLGYHFSITGKVVHGRKIGTLLGFPTANLELLDQNKILPKTGVYFVEIFFNENKYYGMLNIGNNPTFDTNKQSIEVHIFDFNENLYDKEIEIIFLKKIREEKKFDNKQLLIYQLEIDKRLCLTWINETK